jgi:hypothetical protein
VWQLHWAYAAGLELNSPALFIANVEEPATLANFLVPPAAPAPGAAPAGRGGRGGHTGPAFLIKVSAHADGSFTVNNTRNNFSKTYAAK